MLSVPQMLWLVKHARENDSRVLLVGDSAQHRSVERGDALRILERSGTVRYVGITPDAEAKGAGTESRDRGSEGRLEGLYLALATLALAVATPQILKFKGFDYWTGGVQGIQLDPPAAPFGLPINLLSSFSGKFLPRKRLRRRISPGYASAEGQAGSGEQMK